MCRKMFGKVSTTARRWGGTLTRISKAITPTKNNKQELYGSCFFALYDICWFRRWVRPLIYCVHSQHIEHIRLYVSLVWRTLRQCPCLNRVERYAVSSCKFGLRQTGQGADGCEIVILQQCPGVHKLPRIDVRETFEKFGAVGDEVEFAATDVELCYGHFSFLFLPDVLFCEYIDQFTRVCLV